MKGRGDFAPHPAPTIDRASLTVNTLYDRITILYEQGEGGGKIEPFEVFAIRYARHSGRRAADNFLGADSHETGADLDYFVWVARRSDTLFVIDTGFGPAAAAARGRTLLRSPVAGLALLGIDARAVEEVVLTHLHYDHAGTLEDFPSARFHVQDAEMAYATGRSMAHAPLRAPYGVEDVVALLRCLYAGRVRFHAGAAELAPGLWVHEIGGHSAGLQAVRVWTRRGWVVLASDAAHYYANIASGRPFPILQDMAAMFEGFQTLFALADSPDHIVPGHDPLVLSLYRPPSPELEGIVVRLDDPPIRPAPLTR